MNHNKMTFAMTYACSENYILVLSHDEVVHLKCSMLNKMPGEYTDKFRNLKLAYTYMTGHPGKKLLFMGQEFGQPNEWSEAKALDWHVAAEPEHASLQQFVKRLFQLYRSYPALYTTDYNPEGFQWSNANDYENSVFSFMRYSGDGKKSLLFILNFTPVERPSYKIGVPDAGKYRLVLDETGGSGEVLTSVKADCSGFEDSVLVNLSSYGIRVYEFQHQKHKKRNLQKGKRRHKNKK